MTDEISTLMHGLHLSSRGPVDSPVTRIAQGQSVAGARQVDSGQALGQTRKGQEGAQAEQAIDSEALNGMVSDLNGLAQEMRRELRFAVDEDSGELVVKIIDSETDEVLRQIPPEEVLKMRERLAEAAGVIFRGAV